MIENILSFVMVLLGIPVGLLIAWWSRDELIDGRNWFIWIIIIGILGAIGSFLFGEPSFAVALLFLAVVALVSYHKSFDRKWTKKPL